MHQKYFCLISEQRAHPAVGTSHFNHTKDHIPMRTIFSLLAGSCLAVVISACSTQDHGTSDVLSGSSVNSGVPRPPTALQIRFNQPLNASFASNSDWLKVKAMIKAESAKNNLCLSLVLQDALRGDGPAIASVRVEFKDYKRFVEVSNQLQPTLSSSAQVASASGYTCGLSEVAVTLVAKPAEILYNQLKGNATVSGETRSVQAVVCAHNGSSDPMSCTITRDLDHISAVAQGQSMALFSALRDGLDQQNLANAIATIHDVNCRSSGNQFTCKLKVLH